MVKRTYLQRILKSDAGFALATTLSAVLLVTAIGTASYFVAINSLGQAQRSSATNQAYQVAVSALEYELSRLEGGAELTSANNKVLPTGENYNLEVIRNGHNMSLSVRASRGGLTEQVRQDFQILSLSDSVYSGAGNIFSGPQFNSPQSMLIGQVYLKVNKGTKVNSSIQFVDGPLYVEGGQLEPKGGVQWKTIQTNPYKIFADLPISSLPSNVEVSDLGSPMVPPVITEEFINSLKVASQSNGNYFGSSATIGAGGTQYNPNWDGIFKANGVIFCEGSVTIPSNIIGYEGNFVIFAREGINVQGRLVPKDFAYGNSSAYDDTYNASLGVRLPKVSQNYCAALISPQSINLSWTTGNNSSTPFTFCGAVFSGSSVNFMESLRGTIIGTTGLSPNKKTILATQPDLSTYIHESVKSLFSNIISRGNWSRKAL